MKQALLISGILLIFSCKNENDKNNSTAADIISSKVKSHSLNFDNNLNSVAGIKQEYNKIYSRLAQKKLDSVSFDYQCEETSGNVVYYSEKNVLKVVKHFQADSHYSSTETYFVNDGKPYFIFKDETVWSFDGGTPEKPVTKDEVTEQRFYVVNNKAIQCLEKKYILKSNSKDNPKSENIPNKEMKNCSVADLRKDFDLLIKNRDREGDRKCL